MSEKVYEVPVDWSKRAWVDAAQYEEMYADSIKDPDAFWAEHGKRIHWFKPFTKVKDVSFDPHHVSIKWFEDGVTNVAYNCIDRHLPSARPPDRDHLGGRQSRPGPSTSLTASSPTMSATSPTC